MKKEKNVIKIINNLKKLSTSEYSFELINSWEFPDGHKPDYLFKDRSSGGVLLRIKDTPVGMLLFKIYNNSKINIEFIQGVKRKNNPEIKLNKPWVELLLDNFILASSKLIFNQKFKLQFIFFKSSRSNLLKRHNESKLIIKDLEGIIKNIKKTIELQKKQDNVDSKSLKNLRYLRERLFTEKLNFRQLENQLKLYGGIRDRYLDKEGMLNLNKERVKKMYQEYIIFMNKPKNIFTKTIAKLKEKTKKYVFKKK